MRELIRKTITGTARMTFAMLFAQPAIAHDVFYCIAELSTGIIKEDNQWQETSFEPDRFTIKFANGFSSATSPSFSDRTMECHNPYPGETESIQCIDNFEALIFNKKNLRFIYFYGDPKGYADNPVDPDTNSLDAGVCEQF